VRVLLCVKKKKKQRVRERNKIQKKVGETKAGRESETRASQREKEKKSIFLHGFD